MGDIHQTHVRDRRRPGKPGQLYDSSRLNDEVNVTNEDPQRVQQDTVSVDTAEDDTEYSYEVNGIEVSITSEESGATTESIAEALAEEHNASPMVRGQVVAEEDGSDVNLESTHPGVEYDVETDDDNLSHTEDQSAEEADPVPFGRVVIRAGDSDVDPYPNRLGKLADESGLDEQSVTLDHGEADDAEVLLRIDGALYEGSGNTAANLASDINDAVPDDTVTASDSGTEVTIEVDTAGDSFELASLSGDINLEDEQAGDRMEDLALGISRYTYDEETSGRGRSEEYPPNAGVSVLRRGRIWVERFTPVSETDPVYVQMTGNNKGKLYDERDAGRVYAGDLFRWYADRSGEGLAVVECNI